jgi:hypothetical protein
VTVLPFGTQRHGRVFEVAYLDLLCAYDSSYSDLTYCVSGSPNRPGYSPALSAAASGRAATTVAASGSAKLSSKASMQ